MKRILLFIATVIFSIVAFAQENINVELQTGYFLDQHIDGAINDWSPDMSSPAGYDDNEMSTRLSVNYTMSDKINLDFIYGNGSSNGHNDIERYVTNFTELGVAANYNVYTKSNFDVFLNVGLSMIDFSSERTLVSGSEVPHSSMKDNSDVTSIGTKIKYTPTSNFYIIFSYSLYSVKHDGFDGWDDGEGSDELIYRGIGFGFNIK